uniref:CCHC-type domain-containing protein n=1 Tax=Psilocybe cubensis TaxID=181762 RepID=A0A8H7XUJ3_PSICU
MLSFPIPDSHNVPKFVPTKLAELLRFIDQMEDLYKEHKITDDKKKIARLGKYASADTEEEWKAFDLFRGNSWDAYKQEVISSYSAATNLVHGSYLKIKKICAPYVGRNRITSDDISKLLKLKRAFGAAAAKIMKDPPLISNQEVVELFLGCLSTSFRTRIRDKMDDALDSRRLAAENLVGEERKAALAKLETRLDDRYCYSDVIAMAIKIVDRVSQASAMAIDLTDDRDDEDIPREYTKEIKKEYNKADDVVPKIEEAVAQISNMLNLLMKKEAARDKQNELFDRKFNSLQTPPPRAPNFGYTNNGNSSYNNPGFAPRLQPQSIIGCFYCRDLTHRISECPLAKQHEKNKWIIRDGGRVYNIDGSRIAQDGNKSIKEVVKQRNAPRLGVIPIAKLPPQPGFFQDQENDDYEVDNGDIQIARIMTALLQQHGQDTVERGRVARNVLLTTRLATKNLENKNANKKVTFKETENNEGSVEEDELDDEEESPPMKVGPPKHQKVEVVIPIRRALTKKPEVAVPETVTTPKKEKVPEILFVGIPPIEIVERLTDTDKPTLDTPVVKPGPAYRTREPIKAEVEADNIIDEILDLKVGVPLKQLVGNTPAVRERLRKRFTKTRQALLQETKSAYEPYAEDIELD